MSTLPSTAELIVGSDLRIASSNSAWRRLNLPGGKAGARERLDKLFPSSDIAACALDVLASGIASENVLVRLDNGRYLLFSLYPSPSADKPKQVLMKAWEMTAQAMIDAETGEILETFGTELTAPPASAWRVALNAAVTKGQQYLGRFQHRRTDGSDVRMESFLVLVDEGGHN